MAGCLTCSRCMETTATSLAKTGPRLVRYVLWGMWTDIFRKRCPTCRHFLSDHRTTI